MNDENLNVVEDNGIFLLYIKTKIHCMPTVLVIFSYAYFIFLSAPVLMIVQ